MEWRGEMCMPGRATHNTSVSLACKHVEQTPVHTCSGGHEHDRCFVWKPQRDVHLQRCVIRVSLVDGWHSAFELQQVVVFAGVTYCATAARHRRVSNSHRRRQH